MSFFLVFYTLLDCWFEQLFFHHVEGMGIPIGYVFPAGNEDGEKMSPMSLSGGRDGEISLRADEDGEAVPDWEFPVAISTQGG
jgi:hypothetical protein